MQSLPSTSRQTAPNAAHAGGSASLVQLSPDHPGFSDPVYRARRNAIARLALDYQQGQPVPVADYVEEEHAVWADVWQALAPLHAELACKEYQEALGDLNPSRQRIPQLQAINERIEPVSGYSMLPVAGLVESSVFLRYLARPVFLSTQYIRHVSRPFYTPEPDVVHELIGHAPTFMHKGYCKLSRAFGLAANRTNDQKLLARIGRLYWFTLEFGVVHEGGELRACGAGLLSSSGELARFREHAELLPFDPNVVVATEYDPTGYQSVLFVAPNFAGMVNASLAWLAKV